MTVTSNPTDVFFLEKIACSNCENILFHAMQTYLLFPLFYLKKKLDKSEITKLQNTFVPFYSRWIQDKLKIHIEQDSTY